MKDLYIVKAGTTFPAIAGQFGDFDIWTLDGLGAAGIGMCVLDAEHGAALPAATDCAGIIVTGSHSMVTEGLPWSIRLEKWILSLLDSNIPFLGICYGHQLLARSAGGKVDFHPLGLEIGTVYVDLLPGCENDPIFKMLPKRFAAHATHSQTVVQLPPESIRLAGNAHEPNHAFRIGESAWGIQFHPEYSPGIMRAYIMGYADELVRAGHNVRELLDAVTETPFAARVLDNFGRFVEDRQGA